MKKLLTSIALYCGIASVSNAQEYTPSANPVDSFTYGIVHQMVLSHYLIANPADSITCTWRMISTELPASWAVIGYCDNIDCYGDPATLNGDFTHSTHNFNQNNNCQLTLNVLTAAATINEMAVVKVRMQTTKYNNNDTLGQVDTLVYRINPQQTTGITAISTNERFKTWPIPAKESISVFADKTLNTSNIAIVNMIGQTVYTMAQKNETSIIDIRHLAKGLYMIQMTGR